MTDQPQVTKQEPPPEEVPNVGTELQSVLSTATRRSVRILEPEAEPGPEKSNASPALAPSGCTCTCHQTIASASAESERFPGSINHHEGIYWPSPAAMVSFFLFGVITALMHHVYYHYLDGKQVGNDSEQQWALRWGTTFAYLTQVSLVTSIGFAYTQWLWLSLKKKKISVGALDAAMGADASLVSLLNFEMISKIPVGSFLALVIGLLPLTSLVPPATLFVLPDLYTTSDIGPLPTLDMYGPHEMKRFAHSGNSSDNLTAQLLSPRTIVSRLSSATAALGEILPATPPFINSSYSLHFYGPSVKCQEADSKTATIIDNIRDATVFSNTPGSLDKESNYYFAFVPDLISNTWNKSAPNGGVTAVSQFRLSQPQNASNQLWIGLSRYSGAIDSQGHGLTEDLYMTCKLYNASYNLILSFEEGRQNITDNGTTMLNVVEYPNGMETLSDELMVQHAYSAVFWAMTDLLVGSMNFFISNTTPPTNFTEIKTELQYISLLGSSDLHAFFDANHPHNTTIGDQRAQDIALAKNRTLEVLIPELMFNITATFMSSNLLSPSVNMTFTRWDSVNTYVYHTRNLLLSYGIAIALALVANILAAYAYRHNGVSFNKSFSAVLSATRHKSLTDLFHYEIVGRLPLSKKVKKALVKFGDASERRQSLGGVAELGFVRKMPYEYKEDDWIDKFSDRISGWVKSKLPRKYR